MVWSCAKEGRDGYYQEDGRLHGKGIGRMPKNRWLDNIMDDMKEYKMMKDTAHNRSVSHRKTTAGPLLHGGGLRVR